jgi:signal transduction histidine kinase
MRLKIIFSLFLLTGVCLAQNELKTLIESDYAKAKKEILNGAYHALPAEERAVTASLYLQKSFQIEGANSAIKAAQYLYASEKTSSIKGVLAVSLGNTYVMAGVLDSAEMYYLKGLSIAQKNEDSTSMARANNNLANLYIKKSEFGNAERHLEKARLIFEAQKDSSLLANVQTLKGNIQLYQNNLQGALKEYLEGLKILRKELNPHVYANLESNTGMVYNEIKKFAKAIPHLKDAAQTYLEIGSSARHAYVNLGESYRHSNLDSAEYYYKEALKLSQDYQVDELIYRDLTNLALVLENKGQTSEAKSMYLRALEIANKEENSFSEKSQLLANLSNIHANEGNIGRSKEYAQEALKLSLKENNFELILASYQALSNSHEQNREYQKALEYTNLANQYEDSILNKATLEAIADAEVKYETVKKDKELAIAERDNVKAKNEKIKAEKEKQRAKLASQKKEFWLYIIGALGLLIVLGSILVLEINKRRAERDKNKAILKEKDRGISAVIDAQEEERKRISKDLHDGIGQQLSGLKLAWNSISTELAKAQPTLTNKLLEASKVLDESAEDLRNISHQMMPRSLQEFGLIPAVEDMLDKAFKFSDIESDFFHHGLRDRYDSRTEICIYRILQELVNNISKHSQAKLVNVQLMELNGHLVLMVEDNGVGIKASESKGHGMNNIKTRLSMVNGEYHFDSGNSKGTTATIRIPIA